MMPSYIPITPTSLPVTSTSVPQFMPYSPMTVSPDSHRDQTLSASPKHASRRGHKSMGRSAHRNTQRDPKAKNERATSPMRPQFASSSNAINMRSLNPNGMPLLSQHPMMTSSVYPMMPTGYAPIAANPATVAPAYPYMYSHPSLMHPMMHPNVMDQEGSSESSSDSSEESGERSAAVPHHHYPMIPTASLPRRAKQSPAVSGAQNLHPLLAQWIAAYPKNIPNRTKIIVTPIGQESHARSEDSSSQYSSEMMVRERGGGSHIAPPTMQKKRVGCCGQADIQAQMPMLNKHRRSLDEFYRGPAEMHRRKPHQLKAQGRAC